MKTYKTLKEVVDAVKSGELDESQLLVVMDNDCSHIYFGPRLDADGEENEDCICIYRGKGYRDTEDLWPLVLPNADVEWC